jgi:16S rRNA (guanine527-N7)-methyltransferase
MVDSIRKKLLVAENVAAAIGLTNITTQHSRVEEIKDRKFDIVISRAVAPLKNLWSWSYPLLSTTLKLKRTDPHGLICLKGGNLENEIAESGRNPQVWEIHKFFKEDFFKEKYLLYISC